MFAFARRTVTATVVVALAIVLGPLATPAATGDAALRAKIVGSFAHVRSYRLTVLGEARSLGVWVAPDRYQMTTELGGGKPIKTVIIGRAYWTRSGDRWDRSGRVSSNLDIDIAGLVRDATVRRSASFARLPEQTQDGKRVGTFGYTFANGTEETCNYDRATYRVTRCKADEVTILYAGYNDPTNRVASPR